MSWWRDDVFNVSSGNRTVCDLCSNKHYRRQRRKEMHPDQETSSEEATDGISFQAAKFFFLFFTDFSGMDQLLATGAVVSMHIVTILLFCRAVSSFLVV